MHFVKGFIQMVYVEKSLWVFVTGLCHEFMSQVYPNAFVKGFMSRVYVTSLSKCILLMGFCHRFMSQVYPNGFCREELMRLLPGSALLYPGNCVSPATRHPITGRITRTSGPFRQLLSLASRYM